MRGEHREGAHRGGAQGGAQRKDRQRGGLGGRGRSREVGTGSKGREEAGGQQEADVRGADALGPSPPLQPVPGPGQLSAPGPLPLPAASTATRASETTVPRSSVSPGKFWSPHPHPLRDSRTRRPGRGAGGPLTAVLTHLLAHEAPDVVLLAKQRHTRRECRGTASGQGPGPGVSGQGQGSGIRGSHSLSARLLPSRLGGQQGQAAPAGKRGARL